MPAASVAAPTRAAPSSSKASAAFEEDIRAVLAEAWTIPAEGVMGGSNRASVEQQLKVLRGWLEGGKVIGSC